jgi:1-acyl-sn-glycerol-3-phosphate acyltransferase
LFWSKEANFNEMLFYFAIFLSIKPLLASTSIFMGTLPLYKGLIVANHRSYFDPHVESQANLPVGKREVASWSLGYICKNIRVIFVDRKDCESRQNLVKRLKKHSSQGTFGY